MELEDTTQKR